MDSIFSSFKGNPQELIPLLQKTQEEHGFLSDDSMKEIAAFAKVPLSKVYGVATFYAQFCFSPKGKEHIMICRGTACHVKGAPRIMYELETKLGIKEGETSKDGKYSVESVACIGACSLAPCIVVNDKVEAKLQPKDIQKLFSK